MPAKPVIIAFTSFYEPTVGGAEIAVKETISRLSRDFEFHIITYRLNINLPEEQEVTVDGGEIFVHRIGFGTTLDRMFLFPFLAAKESFFLVKKFKDRKILLWGIMVSYASIGAFFVKMFKRNIPFVLTIQEGDGEWKVRLRNFGLSALWWKLIFNKANYVAAISGYLENVVKKSGYKGLVEIVPNGVDEKFLQIQHPDSADDKIIFSASRLEKKNGLDILLKAAAMLKDEYSFRVVIAGDGKEKKYLIDLRDALDLKDRVEFVGNIPYEKLDKLYAAADIFVRPSRTEGLGSAFLEAMAAGLVTIGTPVGGITDFLWEGSTGFLAKPENVENLAEAMKTALVLAPARKAQIVGNARALIKTKYLWADVALKMKSAFNKFL